MVIDTNVVVSAILTPKGTAAKAVGLISSGRLIPCYDLRIMDEYHKVLHRAKFNFNKSLVLQFLALIKDVGVEITSKPSIIVFPDKSDRKFHDVAKSAGACLVTGNTKHFPREDWILTPAKLLRRYEITD